MDATFSSVTLDVGKIVLNISRPFSVGLFGDLFNKNRLICRGWIDEEALKQQAKGGMIIGVQLGI